MKLRAQTVESSVNRLQLRGGASPSFELDNYLIGVANNYRTLTFDESKPNAEFWASASFIEGSGPSETYVRVERLSIPYGESIDWDPFAEIQAPDLKGLNYGTAVRYDDNYVYAFYANRAR